MKSGARMLFENSPGHPCLRDLGRPPRDHQLSSLSRQCWCTHLSACHSSRMEVLRRHASLWCVSHLSLFLCLVWCSGSRRWAMKKLRAVKTAQVRMTRRVASWWPKAREDCPLFARRTAQWSEECGKPQVSPDETQHSLPLGGDGKDILRVSQNANYNDGLVW